jgi:hypothetical protein
VDVASGFVATLSCLGAAGVRALVTSNLARDLAADAPTDGLPDLTPCFVAAASVASVAAAHFALVRYQDYAAEQVLAGCARRGR